MPGNYTITTRAVGTIVTALIYNHDHQVHVDGRDSPGMGSLSNAIGQMQSTTPPAPGGTPNLSPSLSGELERLRFEFNYLKSVLQGGIPPTSWYVDVTPGYTAIGAMLWQLNDQTIPTAVPTAVDWTGNTPVFNTNTTWDVGNPTRFTAPFTGKYWAFGVIVFSQFNSGGIRALEIVKNGVLPGFARQGMTQDSAAHFQYLNICVPVDMVAGDFVEITARQTSGTNLFLFGNSNGSAGPPTTTQYLAGGLVLIGTN